MKQINFENDNHRFHALEWRLEDVCLMCLVETIETNQGLMKIHRRFALSTLNQRLGHDPSTSTPQSASKLDDNKALTRLLQKNQTIATKLVAVLLGALTCTDIVDLAVEAIYRLYYHALRQQNCLHTILSHCSEKIIEDLLDDTERWIPYLSVMQRLARLEPASVALVLGQNAFTQIEILIVDHLGDGKFSELAAWHVLSFIDPLVRSGDLTFIRPHRRPAVMHQLARLLLNSSAQQLQLAALSFAHMLWSKQDCDWNLPSNDQLPVSMACALKRIILQSPSELQAHGLQVLDAMLWKCWQTPEGPMITSALLDQSMAELIFDVMYNIQHPPLIEYSLRCLQHLSRCPDFFQHRVILGVEPLLRVIPNLIGGHLGGGLIAAYAVHLLSDMLSKYQGEESLLDRAGSGFHSAACCVASTSLQSSSMHLETGGACLTAALLQRKNLPTPLPFESICHLVSSAAQYLAPQRQKWKKESSYQLLALIKVLSAATTLVCNAIDDPRLLLSTYSTVMDEDLGLDKLVLLVTDTIDRLVIAVHQIDDSILWTALFALLAQLGATGSLSASTYVNAIAGRGLLVLCFNLRKSAPVFEAANQLISSWMARWLQPSLHDPFGAIVTLVRSIPVDLTELGPWIGRQGDSVPFASKCAALLLLYHLELSADYKDSADPFVGDQCDSILSGIGDLMLTHSPCDMDDADLLRSLWFLIAKYSARGLERTAGNQEASSAFIHLIRWFQPDGAQLQSWLSRIYTHHCCLMMWTFSVKDVAQYLGAHMIQLWMTPTEQQTDREESLTQLCLQMSDDGFLIFAIFDLVFSDEKDLSCLMTKVLYKVAEQSRSACCSLGRLVKYNVPRFLRLTDVSCSNSSDSNYVRLIGSLRLLCRLATASSTSTDWKDPSIVSALVSFLPRTADLHQHWPPPHRPTEDDDDDARIDSYAQEDNDIVGKMPVQVELTTVELWSWSCRYLATAINDPTDRVVIQMVVENKALLSFIDQLCRRHQLPVWTDVLALTAALAAHHHSNKLNVISSINISTDRLVRQLSAGLVMDKAERAEAQDDDDEDDRHQSFIGHIFQLLTAILRQDGFIIGDMTQDISSSLWFLLLNWTLRLEPHLMVHLLRCQLELLRYIKLHWPTHRVARLISLPWNHLVLLHIVQSPMHSQCADLVRQLISQSNDSSGSCSFPGLATTRIWSGQLEQSFVVTEDLIVTTTATASAAVPDVS